MKNSATIPNGQVINMNIHQPIIVTVSYPDHDIACEQAKQLIEKKLIACAQLTPTESIYLWKNQLENSNEVIMHAKTVQALWQSILETVKATHPYELPEIIATPIIEIDKSYLLWMLNELGISG
jgi:periplasmic divalent cation tolerance protein